MTGILFFAKERILPGCHVVFKILDEILDPCWTKVMWRAEVGRRQDMKACTGGRGREEDESPPRRRLLTLKEDQLKRM